MQKFSDIRGTANARMNLDASPEVMPQGMMGEIMHMTDDGRGQLVNMRGFENVMDMVVNSAFTMPSGTFKCIGTARDVEGSSLVYFLCDTVGTAHSIMAMNTDTKALSWILRDEPLLNFKAGYRISANVIEGLLYWTDGYFGSFLGSDYNPPRKVNMAKAARYTEKKYDGKAFAFYKVAEAASLTGNASYLNYTAYVGSSSWDSSLFGSLKVVAFALDGINRYKNSSGYGQIIYNYIDSGTYIIVTNRPWQDTTIVEKDIAGTLMTYEPETYFGIDWQVMDVVKWKPTAPPTAEYQTDSTVVTNRLQNKLFQFAYKTVHDDNEKSVLSPISAIPLPHTSELLSGAYDNTTVADNCIDIAVDTGPMEVVSLEIFAREGNVGEWNLIKRIYKFNTSDECEISSDIPYTFRFYNSEVAESMSPDDISRPYDFVPIVAKRQEIIEKNRIVYADYREGFDRVDPDVDLFVAQIDRVLSAGNLNVPFTTHSYPYSPPSPVVGYPMYAQTVKWNRGVVSTSYPQSPQTYGCVVMNLHNMPIIVGKTYLLQISASTFRYNNSPIPNIERWPDYCEGDSAVATAVVPCESGDTLSDMLNKLAIALRQNGVNSNYGALGFTAVPYKSYNNHIWGDWTAQGESGNSEFNIGVDELGVVLIIGSGNNIDMDNVFADMTIVDELYKYETFKSGEEKDFGVEYSDRAGRFGFANGNSGTTIYVPTQQEMNPGGELKSNIIKWEVNHSPPPEATHWRWVMRKRPQLTYYMHVPVYNIDRSSKMGSLTGNYLAISVIQNFIVTKENYNKFNVPAYEWKQGDRVRFVMSSRVGADGLDEFSVFFNALDFEILSVESPDDTGTGGTYLKDDLGAYITDPAGNKIKDTTLYKLIIPNFNYAEYGIDGDNLEENKVIVEIYRNSPDVQNGIYYQISPTYPVINPHTESRYHGGGTSGVISGWDRNQTSVLSARGTIDTGDAYVRQRFMMNDYFSAVFPVEDMSFSDWYNSNDISIGAPNQESRDAKFQRYISNLRYGGKLVQDTRINDLGKFTGSDFITLADKYGAINSIEEVGDTLKVIQRSKVSSVYIGRAGVTQPSADSTEILSSTKDVLGTLIVHRTDYGTVHPGSVVRFENRHYWFDFFAHSLLRDPGNGIQNLTEQHGLKRFMAEWCRTWGSPEAVTVTSGYDQENSLVWWTFNSDQGGFSVAFRDNGGSKEDGFATMGQFIPDEYGTSKYVATVFKDGQLWLMNSDNVPRCNFFGTQYKYWFTPVFNPSPLTVKRWLQILISTAKRFGAPNAGDVSVPISGNSPAGMVSLLKPAALTSVQGKMVADFGKNMTTKSLTPSNADLVNGEDLAGPCLTVRLEGSETTEHKVLAVEVKGVAI